MDCLVCMDIRLAMRLDGLANSVWSCKRKCGHAPQRMAHKDNALLLCSGLINCFHKGAWFISSAADAGDQCQPVHKTLRAGSITELPTY